MRRGLRACVALNDLSGARRLYLALGKALREDLDTTPLKENSSLLPPSDISLLSVLCQSLLVLY